MVCSTQKIELQLPTMHPSLFPPCFGIFSLKASSAGQGVLDHMEQHSEIMFLWNTEISACLLGQWD